MDVTMYFLLYRSTNDDIPWNSDDTEYSSVPAAKKAAVKYIQRGYEVIIAIPYARPQKTAIQWIDV